MCVISGAGGAADAADRVGTRVSFVTDGGCCACRYDCMTGDKRRTQTEGSCIIPRPAGGGGGQRPPLCGFSQIAPEVLGISL